MGISRAPVREAARRLESSGLLVARPRHGFAVRDFTLQQVDDLYQVRIQLELMGARLACRHASDAACDALLWPHVTEFVKRHADLAPQLDVLGEMAHEPTGSLLAHAMSVCYKTDATGSDRQGPWAGARVAVLQAIWRNQLEFDQQDRSAQNIHELDWPVWPQPGPAHTSWTRRERGIIASVAPGADGVTVTFKSTKVKFEKCLASRETDKIDAIEDGHIVYRTVCTKWGWETTTDTVEPQGE